MDLVRKIDKQLERLFVTRTDRDTFKRVSKMSKKYAIMKKLAEQYGSMSNNDDEYPRCICKSPGGDQIDGPCACSIVKSIHSELQEELSKITSGDIYNDDDHVQNVDH